MSRFRLNAGTTYLLFLLRHAKCLPLARFEVLGEEDDLADVSGIVSELTIERFNDSVIFAADDDDSFEVLRAQCQ